MLEAVFYGSSKILPVVAAGFHVGVRLGGIGKRIDVLGAELELRRWRPS